MKKATKIGNYIVRIVTGIIAAFFLLYGGLMLWDIFRTEIRAFASYDLLQYRPNIEENEPPYLDELLAINKDTTGWLTIYNTNIDYPVMQGENDMKYINRDVYGEYTVTGSIFMSSDNAKDYSDNYTLLYGHHMTNGSMFGDLFKFKKKEFFDKNEDGVLIREEMAYDLKIMAILETNAYEDQVYQVKKDDLGEFLSFLKANAMFYRDIPADKILALSTCDDANTSGRTILVCSMSERTEPLPAKEKGKPSVRRKAMGHPLAGSYWSLINLICLLAAFFFLIRLVWTKRKDLKHLNILIGLAVTLVLLFLFIITEDMRKPIQMTDQWTPLMIGLLFLFWFAHPKDKEESKEDKAETEALEDDTKQS